MELVKLNTPDIVRDYLEKQDFTGCKFNFSKSRTIEPVTKGKNNFTYRLKFANSNTDDDTNETKDGNTRPATAFFKFAGMFATNDPGHPFYEVCAMRDLAPALVKEEGEEKSILKIPEVYYSDHGSHVIIMEDIAPPESPKDDGTIFTSLEKMCQSPIGNNSMDLIDQVGVWLGRFLIRLHNYKPEKKNTPSVDLKQLFEANTASKEIDVQTCLRNVPKKLEEFNIVFEKEKAANLQRVIDDVVSYHLGTPQNIIMGDFWYESFPEILKSYTDTIRFGNIFLKLSGPEEEKKLEEVTIIDWEFVTCAPSYVDLAHYLSEIWLQDRFFPSPSSSALVNRQAAISTFRTYLQLGGQIDFKRLVCYVGAHACCFLDFMDWNNEDGLKRTVAQEGASMILDAASEDWEAVFQTSPFLKILFDLL